MMKWTYNADHAIGMTRGGQRPLQQCLEKTLMNGKPMRME